MTDNNDNNKNQRSSNDISEMLKRLRESMENEKNVGVAETAKDAEITAADDEIKANLERVFEEVSLDTVTEDDEESDVFDDDEEAASWFELEDEEEEDESFADEEDEADDVIDEEADEITEDDVNESGLDEIPEEDPDSDDPWYDSVPAPINAEAFEAVAVDEADGETWYAYSGEKTDTEENDEEEPSEDILDTDSESVWYSGEDDTSDETGEEEPEAYQDEKDEFYDDSDDSEYDPGFEDLGDTVSEDVPENDYGEENVYIYDAELSKEDALDELVENYNEDELTDGEDSVDETDVNLLSTLGISDMDREDVEKENNEKTERTSVSYVYDGEEYVLENQRNDICDDYRRQRKNAFIKLIASGAISLVLLMYEMLPILGWRLPGIFDHVDYPVSYIMISLQLLIITALLSAQTLYNGICDLFVLRSTPASAVSSMLVLNVLYSIAIAITTPDEYIVFNSVAASAITLLTACRYLSAVSEEHIFNVFSAKKKQRYALVKDESEVEAPNDGSVALKATSSDFGKNYFSRMRKTPESYGYISYLIFGAVGASVIVFIVSLIISGRGSEAARNAIITINAAMPVSLAATFSYPFYRATVKAIGKRGSMVGHSAADEYENTRFVTFGEEELFTSLKTTHLDLKPSGDNDISDVLNKTGMLLAEIGGPMKRMVEVMQGDFIDAEVKINEVFDDGVSATADGAEMLAGSARFLRQHGVEVNEKNDFKDVDETNEVLYVSIGGKVAARYYLKYRPDPEFVKLVNALGARGISVGVKTVNPGINSEIIARRCPDLRYKVYTIKSGGGRKDATAQSITDSGIVATEKPKQLIYPLLAAFDLKRYYKVDMILRIILASVSAIVSGVLAFGVGTDNVSPLAVILCQVICLLPATLYGLVHFRHRAKRKRIRIIYK